MAVGNLVAILCLIYRFSPKEYRLRLDGSGNADGLSGENRAKG
jgi:hypothetical protein